MVKYAESWGNIDKNPSQDFEEGQYVVNVDIRRLWCALRGRGTMRRWRG